MEGERSVPHLPVMVVKCPDKQNLLGHKNNLVKVAFPPGLLPPVNFFKIGAILFFMGNRIKLPPEMDWHSNVLDHFCQDAENKHQKRYIRQVV
jgi:hypothetical protein